MPERLLPPKRKRVRKKPGHRCGFVGIAGRPNAGKSTLLNALVGAKLAIVAPKPQTTRTAIQGVLTIPETAQVIFVDTPGIHESSTPLNRRMMQTVRAALEGRDLILYVVDATERLSEEERNAIDAVRKAGVPTVLVLNKIDLLGDKRELLPLMQQYAEAFPFVELAPLSARRGKGVPELKEILLKRLPPGEALYPEDYLTDQPLRFMAAEFIREQLLHLTHQEVPHAVAVTVDKWDEEERRTRIHATIYVEREGQKRIVIGEKGALLKTVGTRARKEIGSWTGRPVFLELFVKVREKWRESAEFLNELDWRTVASSREVGNEIVVDGVAGAGAGSGVGGTGGGRGAKKGAEPGR
jgi:GTPase